MPRRNKGAERDLALHRIRRLIRLAEAGVQTGGDVALSDRYVRLARRIAMRYQVSLPRDVRRRVCRACDGLLVPGRSSRVRVAHSRLTVTCLRCGSIKRYPFTKARETLP